MELRDLAPDEEICLMGFLREIIQADGEYTDAERGVIAKLRAELGHDRFDLAIVNAKKRYSSRHDLKEHAKQIERPEARKLILKVLEEVAGSDGVSESEDKPLRWLASWWDLKA